MRFWLPWWMFPAYLLVWLVFLPVRVLLAIVRRPRRVERPVTRVTIRIQERGTPPPSH